MQWGASCTVKNWIDTVGQAIRNWLRQAQLAGKTLRVDDNEVEDCHGTDCEYAKNTAQMTPHVLALARVSGARLLHSNDKSDCSGILRIRV